MSEKVQTPFEIEIEYRIIYKHTTKWPDDYSGLSLAESVALEKNRRPAEKMEIINDADGQYTIDTVVRL